MKSQKCHSHNLFLNFQSNLRKISDQEICDLEVWYNKFRKLSGGVLKTVLNKKTIFSIFFATLKFIQSQLDFLNLELYSKSTR